MPLTGFSHNLQWSEFRVVNQRPANVSEDAEIIIASRPQYSFRAPPNQNCRVTTVNTNISVNRSGSWVVKGQKSDRLLKHELGHYDITALGAREVHNRVSDITAEKCRPDIDNEARRIQREVQDKINNANLRYDRQTNHSENSTNQTRWDNSIRSAKQNANGTLDDLPT
jgi:predicted secreted Zn-dependent protease